LGGKVAAKNYMEILATITEASLGFEQSEISNPSQRIAVRAIVHDEHGRIALLHSTKKHYHKLPGGGVEENESLIDALKRELREEIGCSAEIQGEVGTIFEERNLFSVHQTSHCFITKKVGAMSQPTLTTDEIAEGFETEWLSLDEAIATLEKESKAKISDHDAHYLALFMVTRDLLFLKTSKGVGQKTTA
jgi:ADP-ribose pyrophosphatase YjhB (NUDIX family)